jgi:hypothetical protein
MIQFIVSPLEILQKKSDIPTKGHISTKLHILLEKLRVGYHMIIII